MEFGKVSDPSKVDFRMPPDAPMTEELLRGSGVATGEGLSFHVGGTQWGLKDWVGGLYPRRAKEKDFLTFYTRQLNTIELNTLFYHLQSIAVIEKWASMAEKGFRFCPKFPSSISHDQPLENAEKDTEQFIDHVRHFGVHLGPSFLQLSDRFGPDRAHLIERYVRRMPVDFPFCLELRHEEWFQGGGIARDCWQLLRTLGIGTVITDTSGRRDCLHMKLTAPRAFIRFVGNDLHSTDFERIDAWAERLSSWIGLGLREVYFFIHSHNEAYAPTLAQYAIGRFNAMCGAGLRVPNLVNGGEPENLSLF